MQIFPIGSRPLPVPRLEAFNHNGQTYVMERAADYTDAAFPAAMKAVVAKRPTPREQARILELRSAFEAKQMADAVAARRAAYVAWEATDPVAQEIKTRP